MTVKPFPEGQLYLQPADYGVIAILLAIPVGIGFYFAYKDRNKVTMDDYLWGGRNMKMLPVALSIFVSFQSAVSLIGFPVEVYMYGSMLFIINVGVTIMCIVTVFTFVPMMHPLRLSSLYEYLQFRFESKAVRLFCTIIGMLQTFCYLIVVLLAPGLALESSTGLPFWLSVVIVGMIGTFYTAIGGIKSVIWTDAFQAVIIMVGLGTVIIKGVIDVGGLAEVYNTANAGGRTAMDNFSFDPRTRHTWWNLVLGGIFMWGTCVYNQQSFQRVSSMKTQKESAMSFILTSPLNASLGFVLIFFGWVMYTYLYQLRCDPLQEKILSNANQLTPYFVLHVVKDLPGFGGLYMSAIFSGALSTLSSGVNCLAANLMEDILKPLFKNRSEKVITNTTKVLSCLFGFTITFIAYLMKSFSGPITQMSMSVVGTFGSILVGIFLLGTCIPWANKHGAFVGAFVALFLNIWLAVGATINGRKTPPMPPVLSDMCNSTTVNSTELTFPTYHDTMPDTYSLYDTSYQWYSVIGSVVSFGVGLLVSFITGYKKGKCTTDPKLIFPVLRKFWKLEVGKEPINGNEMSPVGDDSHVIDRKV